VRVGCIAYAPGVSCRRHVPSCERRQAYKTGCSLRASASARDEAVDFGTTVLKAGMWPHFIMCSSLTLPPAMKACAAHFAAFFEHANASKMVRTRSGAEREAGGRRTRGPVCVCECERARARVRVRS
jgi:hypothetical protein